MSLALDLTIVFVAGLITGVATGVGVAPFFLVRELADRWIVLLWGGAVGILLSVSLFALLAEGLAEGPAWQVLLGALAGVVFVLLADRVVSRMSFTPRPDSRVDTATIVLTVGVLTLHSIPEGIAVGVAFVDLGTEADVVVGGVELPALGVVVSLAIAVVNVPEGLAIAIPLIAAGMSRWRVLAWAIASGLPQPIGAVVAFLFVTTVQGLLPLSVGFAAGALWYLIVASFVPAAIAYGASLSNRGWPELVAGTVVGFVATTGLGLLVG